ncbi:MAG TPA: glycosyltransferase [Solirubrobacterales bacterium]|nr:glycosyltransferase [Solirubrobacterales bacterium]
MSSAEELVVDVVVDNYNYARYLPAAIASARAQTHPRVNVIVVDDGSTDDSRAILDRYRDEVTLLLKENGGQASALNAGFAACEGDVVIFLDADDTLEPTAAAAVAAAFAADPETVKVQFRTEVIDPEGKPIGRIKPADHLPLPKGDVRAAELAYPYDLVWMATSANAFRTAALRRIMPMPEEPFKSCADWYLVHLTALLGRVVSLPQPLGAYRLHGANSYEPQTADLDLDHVRETIRYSEATSRSLLELAAKLDLPRPRRILSLADLANRMISVRLAPESHPLPGDRVGGLLRAAWEAVRRRDNVGLAMRAMFVAWFAAMAVAPRPLARRLAALFLFPERRPGLNRILGRQQAAPEGDAAT